MFRLERYLGHVDAIFARVFGPPRGGGGRGVSVLFGDPRLVQVLREPGDPAGLLPGGAPGRRSWLARAAAARGAPQRARTWTTAWWRRCRRPVTYALFLVGRLGGACTACPLPPALGGPPRHVLFVLGACSWPAWPCAGLRHPPGLVRDRVAPCAARTAWRASSARCSRKLGKIFIVVLAAITLLQHFGVNVASLVVSLGVGSLAIGLAAQDTLANMFAGFTLMLDRPFRVGDRIQLATGEMGDVEAIGMRATRHPDLDETILVVPNSVLVKERVVNLSRPTRARDRARRRGRWPTGATSRACRSLLREAARRAAAWTQTASRWCWSRASAIPASACAWCSGSRDYTEQGLRPERGLRGASSGASARRASRSRSPVRRIVLEAEPPRRGARKRCEEMAKARVYVTLKKSVFDPQGKTIHEALRSLGYASVADVRQGKFFEVDLEGVPADRRAGDRRGDRAARCSRTP